MTYPARSHQRISSNNERWEVSQGRSSIEISVMDMERRTEQFNSQMELCMWEYKPDENQSSKDVTEQNGSQELGEMVFESKGRKGDKSHVTTLGWNPKQWKYEARIQKEKEKEEDKGEDEEGVEIINLIMNRKKGKIINDRLGVGKNRFKSSWCRKRY